MKLIDILNLIAKGELEEGTKIRYSGNVFVYKDSLLLNTQNKDNFSIYGWGSLKEEVEIIGKDTNVATKIEELGYKRYETEDYFEWRKEGITIDFDLQNETVAKYDMRDDAYECITMAELKAINKKCQELGWK